jgi:hypothetical protein
MRCHIVNVLSGGIEGSILEVAILRFVMQMDFSWSVETVVDIAVNPKVWEVSRSKMALYQIN